jgi:hypothetical protein
MDQLSKKIYLGNNTGNYILDFNIKKYIVEYIKKFDLINNKSINNLIDLHYIKNNQYVFTPYFGNENNYYLLFIHHSNYYLSVLIDTSTINMNNINYNKLKIFHIRLRGHKNFYNGTLFEGNLIKVENKSIFLINNIYIHENKIIIENYFTKIKMIDTLLNNVQTDKIFDTFELKVTRYYKIIEKDILEFKNKLPSSKLPIQGMQYISINQNNNNYNISFLQQNNNNTIKHIFLIKKINIPDVYELYCKNNIKYGICYIPNIEKSKQLNNIFDNIESINMECKYNKKFNKFEPLNISNGQLSDYNDIIQFIKLKI